MLLWSSAHQQTHPGKSAPSNHLSYTHHDQAALALEPLQQLDHFLSCLPV
jgi:hypothetical protein